MPSNIRAIPIEGYVTDSAGNVLRNAMISIKEVTPQGSNSVDSVTSDDDGYFTSKPLPNGNYDIYESGIRVIKSIHIADSHTLQVFAASNDNYPENLPPYSQMSYTSDDDINKYKLYIQIEPEELDIKLYGHRFPIYEPNLMIGDLEDLSTFHELIPDSRLTTTRFDVEYFTPLTSTSSNYRRMRWVGIPAIRFKADSRLVLPLDFYSLRLRLPNAVYDFSSVISFNHNDSLETISIYDASDSDADFEEIADNVTKGDILKLTFDDNTNKVFYGIFVEESTYNFHRLLILKKWRSSNYTSNPISGDLENMTAVTDLSKYDGMFNGLENIGVSTNEKYTVVENIETQDSDSEMYNYSDT